MEDGLLHLRNSVGLRVIGAYMISILCFIKPTFLLDLCLRCIRQCFGLGKGCDFITCPCDVQILHDIMMD